MLLDLITNSTKKYANKPFPFLYPVFLRIFLIFIAAFSALAIFFIIISIFIILNLMNSYGLIITAFASIIAFVFLAYFWAAYKGAMINSFISADISQPHMYEYLKYATKNSIKYFVIFAIKNMIVLIANLPIIILFVIFKLEIISLPGIVLLIFCLLISFVCNFIFSFVYIAAAVKDGSAIEAIRNGIKFIIKNSVRAFALYLMCLIVWIMLLIPIFNIITLVSLYPIINIVMINFYKAKLM